jgi:hypothetical protein
MGAFTVNHDLHLLTDDDIQKMQKAGEQNREYVQQYWSRTVVAAREMISRLDTWQRERASDARKSALDA